jgi:predicted nucleic acid-binding protein
MTIELPQTARYVLDTDSVTHQQLGRVAIVQRLAQIPADEIATTAVTMYEQLRGRLASISDFNKHRSIIAEFVYFHLTRRQ